jgi:hypothetical protein
MTEPQRVAKYSMMVDMVHGCLTVPNYKEEGENSTCWLREKR